MGNSGPGGCTGSADVADSNRNVSQKGKETRAPFSTASSSSATEPKGPAVILHVYNLRPGKGHVNTKLGFGIFHSGVEVLGREWSFGGALTATPTDSGVFFLPPETVLPKSQKYRTVPLGHLPTGATNELIEMAVRTKLLKSWRAQTYHVLNHNCNHFSEAFVEALNTTFNTALEVPGWVNRAARIADVLVPDSVLRQMTGATPQAPVDHTSTASVQNSTSMARTAAYAVHGSSASTRTLEDYLIAPNGEPLLDFNGYDPVAAKKQFWERYRAQEEEAQREREDMLREEFKIPATREEASKMSVKHLKTLMWVNGLDWTGCVEKDDLVNALLASRTP